MATELTKEPPVKIAIMAVGGDGGGVLAQWIVKLGEMNDYWSQSTALAGVAQRTGSTIYYLELFPLKEAAGQMPVLAQMPEQGKVDILLATEIVEAGRSLQRGFVSQNTTLIFSTHRSLSIGEKEIPGDGIINSETILQMANKYAGRTVQGDFNKLATRNGSVISACLFGALAASKALPFPQWQFEKVITQSNLSVKQSLAAFHEVIEYLEKNPVLQEKLRVSLADLPAIKLPKALEARVADFPKELHPIFNSALPRLMDWQNEKWALEYLNLVSEIVTMDQGEFLLSQQVAKNLANAMMYDDLVNVAAVKTAANRWQTVYRQVNAKEENVVKVVDYLHPGPDEVTGFLPVRMGLKLRHSQWFSSFFKKYLDRDRRMSTHTLFGFIFLYLIGGMKRYRLKTLRHQEEKENWLGWLERIKEAAKVNYALAVQLAISYRLKKGYGDTYTRGHSKFKSINEFAMKFQGHDQAALQTEILIQFALQNHSLQKVMDKIKEAEAAMSENNFNLVNGSRNK